MSISRRTLLFILLPSALLLHLWRAQAALLLRLLTGGAVIAYLFLPLTRWFGRTLHTGRVGSILLSFLSAAAVLTLVLFLFLPPLLSQMRELVASLPSFAESASRQLTALNLTLSQRGFGSLTLPEIDWNRILPSLSPLLGGTASIAGSILSRFTEWALSFFLAYYFLRDRERLMLHLELLVPASFRRTSIRMVASVHHEIGAFLRGQLLISLIVGILSAAALMLAGVRSFLALGLIVGLFNMIPYFGPLLGAIPAVLMALTQGIGTALLAAAALFAVQQLDSMFISPRIMGAMTGLHPGVVLLAITLGSSLGGVGGMLLAIPAVLAIRAVYRVRNTQEAVN